MLHIAVPVRRLMVSVSTAYCKCGAGESGNLPSPNCAAFYCEIHILHGSGPPNCRDKFKTVLESLWANCNEHIQVEFQISGH